MNINVCVFSVKISIQTILTLQNQAEGSQCSNKDLKTTNVHHNIRIKLQYAQLNAVFYDKSDTFLKVCCLKQNHVANFR